MSNISHNSMSFFFIFSSPRSDAILCVINRSVYIKQFQTKKTIKKKKKQEIVKGTHKRT